MDRLLRIGVFSTLSRISVRMLRYYQEHGVLRPAAVDDWSGRRRYRPDQLIEAGLVAGMRDAGFPVEAMADVLAVAGDPEKVAEAVAVQRRELESRGARLASQLAALDLVEITLRGTEMTQATIKTMPAMTIACLRRVAPAYDSEGELWPEFYAMLGAAGAQISPDALAGTTFHDPEYRETDVDIEVWMSVAAPFDAQAPLTVREVEPMRVVTAELVGDYAGVAAVMPVLGAFIAEHGLRTGPMFNIYRVGPAQNPDSSAWRTDVCLPIVE